MKKLSRGEFNRNPKAAYMGFLFQTFLKRPFGYIIGILYVVYLAVILLIVPAVTKQHPLFIWNISSFNMPIFNLFFIAAETSAIAVAIFRTGRDDGTDLAMSAKPLTKNDTVWIKTGTYIIIMLIFCLISLIIAALILPIFGKYDFYYKPTGITMSEYRGIIVSTLVGNLVNMFLFGGISVFISLVGGQVITMIGTIAIAFLISLLNFIYPIAIRSPNDVIYDDYNASISSFKANTVEQYLSNEPLEGGLSYCAIECFTDEEGNPIIPREELDTKKIWDTAVKTSGNQAINYIDIGKQLSNLYNAFGLEGLRLEDAKQLPIGASVEYDYNIDESSWVCSPERVQDNRFPLCVYDTLSNQGIVYPIVRIVGGGTSNLDLTNWYLLSKLLGVNFNTISMVSNKSSELNPPSEDISPVFMDKYSFIMDELYLTDDQKRVIDGSEGSDGWWKEYMEDPSTSDHNPNFILNKVVDTEEGQEYFYKDKEWEELTGLEKHKIIASIHLYFAYKAWNQQIENVQDVLRHYEEEHIPHPFPFKSREIYDYYKYLDENAAAEVLHIAQDKKIIGVFKNGFTDGVKTEHSPTENGYYSKLVTSSMPYAETYQNLYQYDVAPFYSLYTIIGVWSGLSILFLTTSIIVYKKTDFK